MAPTLQLDFNSVTIDVPLAQRVPYALSRYYLALPLGQDNDSVSVAMAYPDNVKARQVLSRLLEARVVPVFTPAERLLPVLERIYCPETRENPTILAWYELPEWETAVTTAATILSDTLHAPATIHSSTELSLDEVLSLAATDQYEMVVVYHCQDSPTGQHLERCLQRLQTRGIAINLKYRFGNAIEQVVDEVSGDAYDLLVLVRNIGFLLLLMTLLVACGSGRSTANPSDSTEAEPVRISVSGAFALFPIVTVWTEEYSKLHPNVTFDVQAGGAGKGMTDMLTGAADIAMLSRDARQEELDQGSFLVPVTIDAVVGTMNADNPYLAEVQAQGITPEEANAIWITGEITAWGQLLGTDATETLNVYTRSDASGAGEMWALFSQGEAQEDLIGTAVNADPGLAEAVRQDPLGVGYNNIGFSYNQATGAPLGGLQIIPIDLNGNGQIDPDEDFYANRDDLTAAIAAEVYPFPPARVLYLVTKGEPNPTIADFYRWVLSEGQAFVPQAGYVSLTEDRIQEALALLAE